MKLKAIALAAFLVAAATSATSAPLLQTCQPMEVLHSGAAGLGYSLSCSAGDWRLSYTGSVPAGTGAVRANYRLTVNHPDGTSFTHKRSAQLAAPAQLGQALIREAVVLDGGDLALRDCPDVGCTLYRPMGTQGGLAKAVVTVTPEIKRLTLERGLLTVQLAERTAALAENEVKLQDLNQQVAVLAKALAEAEASQAKNTRAHVAERKELADQYAADLTGLENASKAQAAQLATDLNARLAVAKTAQGGAAGQVAALVLERDALKAQLAIAIANQARADEQAQRLTDENRALRTQLVAVKIEFEGAEAELAKAKVGHAAALAGAGKSQEVLGTTAQEQLARNLRMAEVELRLARGEVMALQVTNATVANDVAALKVERDQLVDRIKRTDDSNMTLSTKLEAVTLTRDLAMQNVTVQFAELDDLRAQVAGFAKEAAARAEAGRQAAEVCAKQAAAEEKTSAAVIDQLKADVQVREEALNAASAALVESETSKAELAAYQFVILDLMAQHEAQLTALQPAIPEVEVGSVMTKVSIPTVSEN